MKSFLRTAVVAIALVASASIAQAQSHIYRLNNSFADQLGGPSLVGNAGSLSAAGYDFAAGSSLSLSNVFTSPVYSVIFRSRLTNPTAGYQKLVDFKNLTTDNGYYSDFNATPDFYDGNTEYTGQPGKYNPPAFRVTALTRDATGLFSVYVDNTLQFSFTDTNGDALFSGPSAIAYFGTDDNGFDQGTGRINLLVTYNTALSQQQLEGFEAALPPVVATPEPATMTLLATGLIGVFGAARRRRKTA